MKAYLVRRLGRMAEDSGMINKIKKAVKSYNTSQMAMGSYKRYFGDDKEAQDLLENKED